MTIFFAIEIDAYRPSPSGRVYDIPYGASPYGALSRRPSSPEAYTTVLASDSGYRTRAGDAGGVRLYPPLVEQAFAIARNVGVAPEGAAVAAAAGRVSLANPDSTLDPLLSSWDNDSRPVRVYAGVKTFDPTRGYYVDPPLSSLSLLMTGVSTPWRITDSTLDIPLRDATYWLERPIQSNRYTGGGGYGGHAGLAGAGKPKARGGPILNITPTLIDPVTNTYQYSDAPGTVVQVYSSGNAAYTFVGDTGNLFAGSTSAGGYRTDNSRACFQLASTPSGEITCDVTGAFPAAGAVTNVATLARYLLSEDAVVPSGTLDTASFTAAATACPYAAGVFFPGGTDVTGVEAVGQVLAGVGGKLVPFRNGKLGVVLLRATPATAIPVAAYGPHNAMSVSITGATAPIYRARILYGRNHTSQVSGVSASATAARRAFMAGPGSLAVWFSAFVGAAYLRPADVGPIGGCLVSQADAQAVADAVGALWGVGRRVYTVEIPVEDGVAREIGDIVSVTWPLGTLGDGRLGQIVGDEFRSQDGTMRLHILI